MYSNIFGFCITSLDKPQWLYDLAKMTLDNVFQQQLLPPYFLTTALTEGLLLYIDRLRKAVVHAVTTTQTRRGARLPADTRPERRNTDQDSGATHSRVMTARARAVPSKAASSRRSLQ